MPQFVAPLLRAHVTSGRDQLGSLASLTSQQLDAAASASAAAVKAKLCEVQELLHKISVAEERLKEQLVNTKYQIRQMDVGSTDDFHNGLADRIGRRAVALRCVHLLIAGVGRVAQSRLRKEHAGRALQPGRA